MQQPKFGKKPSGDRLNRIKSSPNFKEGEFKNISHTPPLTEGASYTSILKEFMFGNRPNRIPKIPIPTQKTDLFNLDSNQNIIVWFGHSSYFIQVDGKKILVDPVLSGAASPISSTTRAFKGTDIYTVNDIPEIDILLITHDHWDHLDYQTIKKLRPKVKEIITGLGTAQHIEHWGYPSNMIHEKDWNETIVMADGFVIHTAPARHFSGRGFKRNQAIWLSFVLKTPNFSLYLGGDSGYDTHFKMIGEQYGPFDLAILENGQYDKNWKYIHMMPEEVLIAAKDLQAKKIFPVHSSKFALANHSWNAPLISISESNLKHQLNLITPMIGEAIDLNNENQKFKQWWNL